MLDFAPRLWAELVFHILAHARGTASLAASVYDGRYVAFVREYAGAYEERSLGEDSVLLAQLLTDHRALARVQLLAWLFESVDQARACATLDLMQLQPEHVGSPGLLPALAQAGTAAEILRCAAHLEEPVWELLPPIIVDEPALERAFGVVEQAAPHLRRCSVAFVRALRLRGRVLKRSIWVGAPSVELGLTREHVAWQAAHEATVCEVVEQSEGRRCDHDRTEQAAVVLLSERARSASLTEAHASWFAHLAAPRPPTERAALGEAEAAMVRRCRALHG